MGGMLATVPPAKVRPNPGAGLRVAVDGRSLSGCRGGVASTVENLLRHMARLEPRLELMLVLRATGDRSDLVPASISVRLYAHGVLELTASTGSADM
jgi:hypothetical protein